jgi:hypothetical protein
MTSSPAGKAALRLLEVGSLFLVIAAVVWWAIVYGQVMVNTDFPLARTLPCMLQTSDRCSLAMSLCKEWHFLGIRRYSPELLWVGIGATALALALGSFPNGATRPDEGDRT